MSIIKRIVLALAGITLLLGVSGCVQTDAEYKIRQDRSKEAAQKETLEKQNLRKKLALEEDPERIGYVYLIDFGKPIGYYVIKGKISNSGSQLDPEDLVNCGYSNPIDQPAQSFCEVIDGPQDDGTYGEGDPGIFFFTTEGVYVETQLKPLYSTQPLPTSLDVPKLG